MKLYLVDIYEPLVVEWRRAFKKFSSVEVIQGNILTVAEDTIVSPANGYGAMDGGIDLAYRDFFGVQIEDVVRSTIAENYEEYQPVGQALLVKTGHKKIPRMISAPTMIVPQPIPASNCFLAKNAILNIASQNSKEISSVYCPGLGTGIGGVDPDEAANEMARAYEEFKDKQKLYKRSF